MQAVVVDTVGGYWHFCDLMLGDIVVVETCLNQGYINDSELIVCHGVPS